MIEGNFDAVVLQTDGPEDTLARLQDEEIALICVNRKLDRDYSDGLEVIKQIKADTRGASIPVMLVTNYEEHQQAAMALGAARGFGKLVLADPRTLALLEPFLGGSRSSTANVGSK